MLTATCVCLGAPSYELLIIASGGGGEAALTKISRLFFVEGAGWPAVFWSTGLCNTIKIFPSRHALWALLLVLGWVQRSDSLLLPNVDVGDIYLIKLILDISSEISSSQSYSSSVEQSMVDVISRRISTKPRTQRASSGDRLASSVPTAAWSSGAFIAVDSLCDIAKVPDVPRRLLTQTVVW